MNVYMGSERRHYVGADTLHRQRSLEHGIRRRMVTGLRCGTIDVCGLSGAAAEVADYSGMIARASVLTTSTRHISNLVAAPSIVCVFTSRFRFRRLTHPR